MRSFVPGYDLVHAQTLDEALHMLAANKGWRPIAGGTDLMVLFNAGKLPYRKLVSIRNLPELREFRIEDDAVCLGAAMTYSEIQSQEILQREFPLLCKAASETGAVANQNRGTIGGNLVNASPAADSAPALIVYDAEVEVVSVQGRRQIPYHVFHTGYRQTRLRDDELLCQIRLPRRAATWRHYFRKVGPRRAQAISKVCFAAAAEVSGETIKDIRVALGSVAPIPLRCFHTEAVLKGRCLTPGLITDARAAIENEVQPISDIRSTEEYRRKVSSNLLADFLESLR